METVVAGRNAILRQEGRLVMGWVEDLGLLRYAESVPEVVRALEDGIEGMQDRSVSPVVARRLAQRPSTLVAGASPGQGPATGP